MKKVTIDAVAKAANVSTATVSRVINNQDGVSPDKVARVMEAIRDTNYNLKKHQNISSFVKNKGLLMMVVPNMENPFYSQVFEGACEYAGRYGYTLTMAQSSSVPERINTYLSLLKKGAVEGIILMDSAPDDMMSGLALGDALVQCGEVNEHLDLPSVSIDNRAAAEKVVSYLVSMGKTKILLMNHDLNFSFAQHIEEGYLAALKKAALPVVDKWILHFPAMDYELSLAALNEVLSQKNRPDAVFSASDVFAYAAIASAHRHNFSIADDIAVIGFDNSNYSLLTDPPLSTLDHPRYLMGMEACQLLIEKIKKPSVPSRKILLKSELIVRGSTWLGGL